MTYEQAKRITPTSLEEAIEKTYWRQAGQHSLGAFVPETWAAVASTAREWIENERSRETAEVGLARLERGIRAIAACTLTGVDFGDWVQAVCEDLLDGLEAQCWNCETAVHDGPCVGEVEENPGKEVNSGS